jgi:hypothetical protein
MLCYVQDCIDPATCYIIHCHHDDPDRKCTVNREDENHCVYHICQRHKAKLQHLTEKETEQSIRLRNNNRFVAMHQCQYPSVKGRYRII